LSRRLLAAAWFIAGVPVGSALFAWFAAHDLVALENSVKIVDLAQLGATIFLALYIPLALETYRERRKYAQEMLIEHIRSLVSGLQVVNDYLREKAGITPPADPKCMRVRTGFRTANLKMASIQSRLPLECGNHCSQHLSEFRSAYDRYYESVTNGKLYGNGLVTWELWQRQEFAFIALRDAEIDLVRFVVDHGLK
jgi:hypothetical protein